MRLADLNPVFLSSGGPGISDARTGEPIAKTEGVGVMFDCPCGDHSEEHRCYVPFRNPIGPGPMVRNTEQGWYREGETFDTLTLTPSILRVGGCGWHGFITQGKILP